MLEFLGRFNYNFLLPFLVASDMLIPLQYFNVAGHVMVVSHLGLVPDSSKQLLQVFSSTDKAYNFLLYQPQGASLVETSGRLVCWNHTTASSALSVEITQQLQGALSVEFQTQTTTTFGSSLKPASGSLFSSNVWWQVDGFWCLKNPKKTNYVPLLAGCMCENCVDTCD